ncbi:DUF3096 domain-containing protein [Candidatus Venteria ishoeyi]
MCFICCLYWQVFAILIQPKLLNYIIAFYLIITGALGLMSAAGIHF